MSSGNCNLFFCGRLNIKRKIVSNIANIPANIFSLARYKFGSENRINVSESVKISVVHD